MKNLLLKFMEKAGKIAVKYQDKFDDTHNYFKADNATTIVTEVDLKISKLFKKFLKENMTHDDYIIIDEESLITLGKDKFKTASSKTYQFIIDPIDGTLSYSLKTPLYGIIVGIFKDMKPYMGAVYCPGLHEIVVFDGKEVEHIRNPFTKKAKSNIIDKINTNPVLVFPKPNTVKINIPALNRKKEVMVDFYAAAVHCLYLITGKAKAYNFGICLWDIAGAWPILNKLGFGFFNLKTGKELTKISNDDFSEELKIKELHTICKKEELNRYKEIFILD